MNILEMKRAMKMYEDQRKALADDITRMSADPTTAMDEIRAKKTELAEMDERIANLKAMHDEAEAREKADIAAQANANAVISGKDAGIKAKAAFYRAVFSGKTLDKKSYEGLGGIPAADSDLGSGDKLLPTNLARELLIEPFEINPLRTIARVTNITGLEEPKLGYTIEDADLADVTDKQTANEIALAGDTVAYGRLKAKVSATIKDTVLHGTDVDVVNAVEGALRSALAKREKHFAFQSAASIYNSGTVDSTHRHMSFYNYSGTYSATPTYEITAKTGATMYDAIVAALGDLADDFAVNASVVMKKSDYYAMVKALANDSEALFGSKPASILGYPVHFCDKATIPVVGDFSYYGINYDIGTIFETDKDAKKGEYYWVLTAWGDQQIRLKSAFRLAVVSGE